MSEELKKIKKLYGENMMHLCRKTFPTFLEYPGLLSNIIQSLFEPSRYLYEDIINNSLENEFREYIYSYLTTEEKELLSTNKTPKELLDEAGYILYECKTENDVQKFKKYYQSDEKICTFKEKRTENHYVFFAVKKDVGKIKREEFQNPQREDLYGTSVISIQFSKGRVNTLSIKNRYNHSVDNPDCTFSNNLDNIIPGLTESFRKTYQLNLEQQKFNLNIPGYIKANNGKLYKYNYKFNNTYYCPDNIIIKNSKVIKTYQEKEKYILLDYFILDLVNKEIKLYDQNIKDSFIDGINDIEKIYISKSKENENKTIGIICKNNKIIIELDKTNKIIGYENQNLEEIQDYFLNNNQTVKYLNLPKIKKIGNWFMMRNRFLVDINFPYLEEIGNYFLTYNETIKTLNAPNLKIIKDGFLTSNKNLIELKLENLLKIGDNALTYNQRLKNVDLPKLTHFSFSFLNDNNQNLVEVNIPNIDNQRKKQLVSLSNENKERQLLKENEKNKKRFLSIFPSKYNITI